MQFPTVLISLLAAAAVSGAVTAIVSARVRRAPSTVKWKASRTDALFVVVMQRWRRVLLRTTGILLISIAAIQLLVAATRPQDTPAMAIAGGVMGAAGILFVMFAAGMTRMRLEVTPDAVWVFSPTGAVRPVPVDDIVRLSDLAWNNFGGIAAHSNRQVLFRATRIMAGYPQLIAYIRAYRPDLPIPLGAQPIQSPDNR